METKRQFSNGYTFMEISQGEYLEIELDHLIESTNIENTSNIPKLNVKNRYYGFLVENKKLKKIPSSSNINQIEGKFAWHPDKEFVGEYNFLFIVKMESGESLLKKVIIKIIP